MTDTPLPPAAWPTCPVDEIEIGQRFRKEYGDLVALAASIDARGILHPPVVKPLREGRRELIAGERRVRAWRISERGKAGEPIPYRELDIDDVIAAEWEENAPGIRKDFTLSESVAIARALKPALAEKAAERERAGKPVPAAEKGETAEIVAELVGLGRRTLDRAIAVVEAAEAEPDRFSVLLEQMDKTGRANGPFNRLRNIRQAEQIRAEPPCLPNKGPYRCGSIDLPWASEPDGPSPSETGRGYYQYPTMNTAECCAFGDKVVSLLHPEGGYFWFWVVNFHLVRGYAHEVLNDWSDKAVAAGLGPIVPIGMRTWVKNAWGRGQVFRGETEHVILCKFGRTPPAIATVLSTKLEGDVRSDSEKPEQFYLDVEAATPAPRYFELFARRKMPANWDGFGDQVGTLGEADPAVSDPAEVLEAAYELAAEGAPIGAAGAELADEVEPPVEPAPIAGDGEKRRDDHKRAVDARKEIDQAVTLGPYVEVRSDPYRAIYYAFDLISHDTGAGAGYACYPVPRQHAAELDAIEAALAALAETELREFAVGDYDAQRAIAERSSELKAAHALLGAFLRGWWKRDGEPPEPTGNLDEDQLDIPAFLRRTSDNNLQVAT